MAVCALAALIVGSGYIGHLGYMELRQVNGMDISYDVVCTPGAAENLTGMERVNVHGTVSNTGDEELKNITVTVISVSPKEIG